MDVRPVRCHTASAGRQGRHRVGRAPTLRPPRPRRRARRRGDRAGPHRLPRALPPSPSSTRPTASLPRLLEVYPRLPPEHTLIEETTGVDLVRLQLHVAQGGRLDGEPPTPTRRRLPGPAQRRGSRAGVRAGARSRGSPAARCRARASGSTPPSLRATSSCPAARRWWPRCWRGRRLVTTPGSGCGAALDETIVVIDGGSTNKGFLLDLLTRPEVREARVDNAFVDRLAARGEIAIERDADLALLVAAIDAYETERGRGPGPLLRVGPPWPPPNGARGRPHGRAPLPRPALPVACQPLRPDDLRRRARRDDRGVRLRAARALRAAAAPRFPHRPRIVSAVQGGEHLVEVDGTPHRFRRDDQGIVRSPTPGIVVAMPVAAGEEVLPAIRSRSSRA